MARIEAPSSLGMACIRWAPLVQEVEERIVPVPVQPAQEGRGERMLE